MTSELTEEAQIHTKTSKPHFAIPSKMPILIAFKAAAVLFVHFSTADSRFVTVALLGPINRNSKNKIKIKLIIYSENVYAIS